MANPPAGWYPHPTMAGTQRYWNGTAWTDNVAPLEQQKAPGIFTLARGVALGILIAIACVWVLWQISTSDDQLQCLTENAERAQEGRSLLDCPED